ncbi:MAG: hypothetical protein NW215_10700 [Hyphomicrobiales bacterium]|nr:hypothetical protein [Hyphomicrobiales bacterium]
MQIDWKRINGFGYRYGFAKAPQTGQLVRVDIAIPGAGDVKLNEGTDFVAYIEGEEIARAASLEAAEAELIIALSNLK